jgi:hypothetical protein
MRVVFGLPGAWATLITRYWPAAARSSPLELVLEPLIESEMLAEDAEPALEAEEVKLSAWAGTAQAAAKVARLSARESGVKVMKVFRRTEWGTSLTWYKPGALLKRQARPHSV